ncbi:MAG: SIMPL domain-containing protein, partial [Hymenobacteraceae bacterium]|nr:SIMPL domain-containing protein [Hymenobacteraceae bacterium]MDX5397091.1 SIMPL domain-containing protein [Hymenobacteraceae bacterium]MDX5513169.1 SIMPL domain-containing protein [Hymenobacteraceae bacterium]
MKLNRIFLLLIFCKAAIPFTQAQNTQLPPLVSTVGTGEVKVQPDEVTINLGVETRAKTLEEARKEND